MGRSGHCPDRHVLKSVLPAIFIATIPFSISLQSLSCAGISDCDARSNTHFLRSHQPAWGGETSRRSSWCVTREKIGRKWLSAQQGFLGSQASKRLSNPLPMGAPLIHWHAGGGRIEKLLQLKNKIPEDVTITDLKPGLRQVRRFLEEASLMDAFDVESCLIRDSKNHFPPNTVNPSGTARRLLPSYLLRPPSIPTSLSSRPALSRRVTVAPGVNAYLIARVSNSVATAMWRQSGSVRTRSSTPRRRRWLRRVTVGRLQLLSATPPVSQCSYGGHCSTFFCYRPTHSCLV